jgi:soluble lytic murein transglycosylase-like protein
MPPVTDSAGADVPSPPTSSVPLGAPGATVVEAAAAPNPIEGLADALGRCRRKLTEKERWKIAGAIHQESERFGYDPYFILAMIQVESTCSPTAVGFNGGLGLIQIKPETAAEVAREAGIKWTGERSLTAPVVNVQLGLRYLAKMEKRFRDPYLAMVAYNRGPGRVGKMPRSEARQAQYVRKILKSYENLLAEAD